MRFALYDPSTGHIEAILTCSEVMAAKQVREGQSILPLADDFRGDDTTHAVVDGEIVER